jgi:hypothetical protein
MFRQVSGSIVSLLRGARPRQPLVVSYVGSVILERGVLGFFVGNCITASAWKERRQEADLRKES